ncbi:MAG: phosphoribosylamine--glycine ligase [Xanthomonadales bacterium]|nr:phosphoribosylamine--glycine ligase [Xanthomonadales bacterium]
MKILIVGGGGREHALAWKAAHCEGVDSVFVAPGNAGTEMEPKVENVPIGAEDVDALLEFAGKERIDLTIVGPEAPLVAGISDRFAAADLRCFGPSAAAARLEGSKAYAKSFMAEHGIPTAEHRTFSELDPALAHIRERGAPIVIKADGLAAGKGVIVARNVQEAEEAVRDMLARDAFGEAGREVVVEDFLEGEEASFIVISDGTHVVPLVSSQDHKTRDDGDRGPNTGGMGAYSPAPVVTPSVAQRIRAEVIEPTIRGLREAGTPFVGFLYAGLMIGTDGSPQVLEFNVRCGDPETQPIMMRLKSDLVALCKAAVDGRLEDRRALWDPRTCVGVVMAAGGYPNEYKKGYPILGLDRVADAKVFHAGTRFDDAGHVVTNGGRVLCVCGMGDSIADARAVTYGAVDHIQWHDAFYRRDIGHRALER